MSESFGLYMQMPPDSVDLNKPPISLLKNHAVWGFYFRSATFSPEEENKILDKLKQIYGQREDANAAVWDQADKHYREVMQAFGITTPPAFVMTKAWFDEPFADESWEQLLDLANQHNMPVHAVIQGPEEFQDVEKLVNTIEQLDILFGNYDDKIERALRAAKSRELAHQIEKRVGKVFKSTTIQFGVGATGATVTLKYNEEGAHT